MERLKVTRARKPQWVVRAMYGGEWIEFRCTTHEAVAKLMYKRIQGEGRKVTLEKWECTMREETR